MKRIKPVFHFCSFLFFGLSALLPSFTASAWEVSFEKDDRLPIVELSVALKTGSVSDPQDKSGLTHFLGDMLLRGTLSRTKEQIDASLDQIGAELTVDTQYELMVLQGAVHSDHIDEYLDLLEEIITAPRFSTHEVNREKKETLSLLREQLTSDRNLSSLAFNQFLFQSHPYGRPTLGKEKDVKKFTVKDVKDHYEEIVRADRLLVVGTGNTVNPKIQQFAERLAKLRPAKPIVIEPGKPSQSTNLKAPTPNQKFQVYIVDKPDRTQTQIDAGQIGITLNHPSYFPLYVGNHAFGGGNFASTLMEEIRVKRGWSYGAYSVFRFGTQPRSWNIHLFPATKDTPEALAYTLELAQKLKKSGISKEEFDFAKTSLIRNSGFLYNTPKKRVQNKLLEHVLSAPPGFFESYAQEIERVTWEQTNQALQEFLNPENFAISVVGTASKIKSSIAKSLEIPEKTIKVVPFEDLI